MGVDGLARRLRGNLPLSCFGQKNSFIYTKEETEDFKKDLKPDDLDNTIVVIKNIELFRPDIFDLVSRISNLIISGDVSKSNLNDKILQRPFKTRVYFSSLESVELPKMNKYEGLVVSADYQGITKLE
jgi:hypothetical protein